MGICARGALEINRVEEKKMGGGGSLSLSYLFFLWKSSLCNKRVSAVGIFHKSQENPLRHLRGSPLLCSVFI